MKSLRLIVALAFASMFATTASRADDKAKDKPEAACACGQDTDAKECGKDKECCCKPKEEKKEEKKEEPKK